MSKSTWVVWYCGEKAHPESGGVYLSPMNCVVDWNECQQIAKKELPPLSGKGVGLGNYNEHNLIMLAKKAISQHEACVASSSS